MKLIDTKIDLFSSRIVDNNEFLSLRWNLVTPLSTLTKNNWKIRDIKFDTKIEFRKTRGIVYQIGQKDEGLKLTFQLKF